MGADLGRSSSPGDTYDVVDQRTPEGRFGPSLGVVDDTCEVHFSVVLTTSIERSLDARAVAFVGPPDFAPDRRPFLSLADEINDRCGDATTRNAAMDEGQLDRWVEDLFERIYETVSLFNVDYYRSGPGAAPHRCRQPSSRPWTSTPGNPAADLRHGRQDTLRDPDPQDRRRHGPEPAAPERARACAASQPLRPPEPRGSGGPCPGRIREIVREPFQVEPFETSNVSSMRMPPFMRQSNALPLTVAAWQHDLLMRWVAKTEARRAGRPAMAGLALAPGAPRPLSASAASRRHAVLARLDAAGRRP